MFLRFEPFFKTLQCFMYTSYLFVYVCLENIFQNINHDHKGTIIINTNETPKNI